MPFFKLVSRTGIVLVKAFKRILMIFLKSLFKDAGKNFVFDPFGSYSYSTISVGDSVYIGNGACFNASDSLITIGNKVMFGPNVTIMGGDHNTSQLGKYMIDVKDKLPENDLPVIIEDDVWVGTNATILKGVTIGTGSIIAAGSLVIKDVPEYSVVGGIPARVIKKRFSDKELVTHRKLLLSNPD